ncbi:MAG: hypothetical protein EOP11_12410, partial [Proteobacteria bacterium]
MDGRNKKFFLPQATALLLGALLIQGTAAKAFAADDDLPAPQGTMDDEIPSGEPIGEPPAQDALPDFGASNEEPTANDDALPDPAGSPARNANQVNRQAESDDIFLPTPAVQDNVNYAPLGTPVSSRSTNEDNDWRMGMNNRPAFSFQIGGVARNYGNELVTGNKIGGIVAGSVRVLNIAQTVFLHAYASATYISVGDVGPYPAVKDFTLHVGPMIELGIGRRLSLYGSFLRRSNTITANEGLYKNPAFLEYIDEPTAFQLGFGAQWDFHVVPHGSLGARVHLEKDLAMFLLTMAIEPTPRKRLSLNY